MTNREFFIKTIEAEAPVFLKVLRAVPKDKMEFKPHERARTIGRIAHQLARQPRFISSIVSAGVPDFTGYAAQKEPAFDEIVAIAERNFAELKGVMAGAPDEDWETGAAEMVYPGGKWVARKYEMAWGLLFDAIHHRGQLSTYIRILGGKVPAIYGGSADEAPAAM